MNAEHCRMLIELAVGQAKMLGDLTDWDDLASKTDRNHALGPILDPTLYRAAMVRISPMVDLCRAVGALARAAEKFEKACAESAAACAAVRESGGAA